MAIGVSVGQIIAASHYQSIRNQADEQYRRISSAYFQSTKPRSSNNAYRPHYSYNFSALRAYAGEVITAYKLNTLSSTIDNMRYRDCTCDCNYCTCNCNYCRCNCAYCTCDCNHCTCNCNHGCVCNCAYS